MNLVNNKHYLALSFKAWRLRVLRDRMLYPELRLFPGAKAYMPANDAVKDKFFVKEDVAHKAAETSFNHSFLNNDKIYLAFRPYRCGRSRP